jgi:hypothetical protein
VLGAPRNVSERSALSLAGLVLRYYDELDVFAAFRELDEDAADDDDGGA